MLRLTIIADPCTGLVYESPYVYRDAAAAFRTRREDFWPLSMETRALATPDGCTVADNAAWLAPGEFVDWDGPLARCG